MANVRGANTMTDTTSAEVQRALQALRSFGAVLSIKLYRVTLDPHPAVPVIPCLDHEAMLHETVAPHAAAYVEERPGGDLHELVLIPSARRIEVDVVSTWGESSPASHERLLAVLAQQFPGYRVVIKGPSTWRGERRVAAACRAQVSLRDVLAGQDMEAVKGRIDRLQTISALMEKQSRVASWGTRTATGPILAATGVVTYAVLGALTPQLGEGGVMLLRYALVGLLGGVFLYYGMKAVQLTDMANRVWKRAAEYSLILAERKRLASRGG